MLRSMRRTKIVATIGPASRDPEVLVRMVEAGMDVARLNFSHGSHEEHAEVARRVREAAALLDLEEFLDRKPANLSGGQRQRVAMGRAIVRHPKVFLMDEPLSNLDAVLRVSTRAELKHLHHELAPLRSTSPTTRSRP